MTVKQFVTDKSRMCLYIFLFVFTVSISSLFKTSINKVDRLALDNTVRGVGKVKAEKIIAEREMNGDYKSEEDFRQRTQAYVGKTVHSRIARTYKMK